MSLKGVIIGEGAVVGAQSAVTKDVPPYTVVGGNPAAVLKRVDFKLVLLKRPESCIMQLLNST